MTHGRGVKVVMHARHGGFATVMLVQRRDRDLGMLCQGSCHIHVLETVDLVLYAEDLHST